MTLTPTIKLAGVGDPILGIIGPKSTAGYNPSTNVGGDLTRVLSNLLAFMTIIAGLAFIYYLMLGAVNWMTSGGDVQKAQVSRTMILNALIGLTITVIAYPAILVISRLMGLPLANPQDLLNQLRF